jgi:DNA-binding XRE family transcriptional regulator
MLVITHNARYESPRILATAIRSARLRGRFSHDNIAAKAGVARMTVIRMEKPEQIGCSKLGNVLLVIEALALLGSPVEVEHG